MIFANNRVIAGSVQLEANDAYSTLECAIDAVADQEYNSQLLFEAMLQMDFEEVQALREGNEEVVLEGAGAKIKSMFEKVKKFIENIIKKILGVVKSIKEKILKFLKLDVASQLKKYKADFEKNDLTGMKCKWRDGSIGDEFGIKTEIEALITAANSMLDVVAKVSTKGDIDDLVKSLDEKKIDDKLRGACMGKTEKGDWASDKDFLKDFEEHKIGKEVDKDNTNDIKETVIKILEGEDTKKGLEEVEKSFNSANDKLKKRVDDLADESAKKVEADKDDKDGLKESDAAKQVALANKIISHTQSVGTKLITAAAKICQKRISLSLAVLKQGAKYKKKKDEEKKVEESVFIDALGESTYEDAMITMTNMMYE